MLQAPVVTSAWLMKLDFASETKWVWTGFGLLTVGGQTYEGIGELISVSGVESVPGTSAHPITVTLSGLDPDIIAFSQDEDEYKNRDFVIWQCVFDEDEQPVEPILFRGDGLMDTVAVSMPDATTRSITLSVESLWADRGQTPRATYDATSQEARHPGDLGMRYQTEVSNGSQAVWPRLSK